MIIFINKIIKKIKYFIQRIYLSKRGLEKSAVPAFIRMAGESSSKESVIGAEPPCILR